MAERSVVFSGVLILAAALGLVSVAGCPTGGTGGVGGGFNLPPVPIITTDVSRGVAPLTVSFSSDRSTDDGLIVTRRWEFGDGTSSQDIRPTHTYTTTGEFEVRLTLTDELGSTSTRTQTISVTQSPVAVINVDRTSAASAPAIVNFDALASFDPDGTIEAYRWEFGDGSVELLPTIPHTFSQSGVYRVRLTVTDDKGITDRTEVLVSVGIKTPTIEVRVPNPAVSNIVVGPSSPLYVQAVYTLEPGVTRTVRAGLDGDRDQCGSQTVVAATSTLATALTLAGHASEVSDAAWSPDGAFVLTASTDSTVRLYSATTGDLVGAFATSGPATSVAFAPGGAQFAVGQSDGRVVLRDRASGATIREFAGHTAGVNDVAFSADGLQLASCGNDRQTLVFRVSDATLLRTFVADLALNAVAFSPTDASLLASAGEDTRVRLLNSGSGATVATFTGHAEAVNDLAFSSDGTRLASAGDDDAVRIWSVPGGALLGSLAGHTDDVLAVGFSADGTQLVTGGADGTVRLWNAATFQQLRSGQPCSSGVVAAAFAPNGQRVIAAIAARNDFQLDTSPPSGDDLNVTYPQPLRLNNVKSLNNGSVAPGTYFLWVELSANGAAPVRAYAAATINVTAAFTDAVNVNTPTIPLIADQASVVVDPNAGRQVFDLGGLAQGDRIFLSLAGTPGLSPQYSAGVDQFGAERDFSLAILDANQSIYAWYQPQFILFTPEAKLIIGHSSPHYYVVSDGGNSVNVRIERNTGQFTTRVQRIFVDFENGTDVAVGDLPPLSFPGLTAASYNQFFASSPNWGDNETAIIRQAVMQTLRAKYANYSVQFVGSNESSTPPDLPYMTLHMGNSISAFLYGIADYIDPRNETTTGSGIVYCLTIGGDVIESPFYANPVTTPAGLGAVLGVVAAHEAGHLLGLRHTEDVNDIMFPGGDPTTATSAEFIAATVSAFEQLDLMPPFGVPDVPPIGIQDAPQLLIETVGGN